MTQEPQQQPSSEQEPLLAAEDEVNPQESPQESSVDSLGQELEATRDKYIRLMAEFDNYKRRTSREYERLVETANEKVMVDLIEVRENFQRALKSAQDGADLNGFYDGTKLIYAKLDEVLERNGLQTFTEVGDVFNPEVHDALMKAPHAEVEEDHVAEIFEKGYTLKGRVVKHARVIVSSGQPVQQPQPEPNDTQNA